MITNEILFYGGMIVAGVSALLAFLYFCITQIAKARLNAALDAEYGPEVKKKRKDRKKKH